MGFTRHATDLISEKIGQVTKCGATDVAKEFPGSAAWVSTFGLCVIFQDQPPAQNRACALQFVRRVEMAFAEYSRATSHLSDLVTGGLGRWSPYFCALYHFEAAISQLYLAYDGARKKLGNDYFARDDGSDLDRLNKIFNAGKHQIASCEQTVWITDDGVCADDGAAISFVELEQLMRSYARIANRMTNQEPDPTRSTGP
jgi:hypothetical protein